MQVAIVRLKEGKVVKHAIRFIRRSECLQTTRHSFEPFVVQDAVSRMEVHVAEGFKGI
jgi:hypothetical protein